MICSQYIHDIYFANDILLTNGMVSSTAYQATDPWGPLLHKIIFIMCRIIFNTHKDPNQDRYTNFSHDVWNIYQLI